MRQTPFIVALTSFIVACSAEPAREQAASPAPAQDAAAEEAGLQQQPAVEAPGGPDAPTTDTPVSGTPATGTPATGTAPTASSATGAGRPASEGAQAGPARPDGRGGQAVEAPQQAADEGAEILRRAAAAYENVRSLRADFVMQFENPLLRQSTTSRGTIHQRQPDRIALRFSDPEGDVILSDGEYFWVYYPSVNPQQVIRSPAAAGGESGVNLQAQFVGNPVERFRYELHGGETVGGRAAQVMTLVPRQRAEYRSLKVWLDARDGLARRFEITEHNGSVRRFDLQGLQVNPTIQESVFRFTPPAGARVIDAG